GIVLTRQPGPITINVKVAVEIDWRQSVKDWMSEFAFWEKEKKNWITIDPDKPRTAVPGKVDPLHLELLAENNLLESLCHIRMPEEYRPNSGASSSEQTVDGVKDAVITTCSAIVD